MRVMVMLLSMMLAMMLAGCAGGSAGAAPLAALALAEGASVAVFGRGVIDIGVSALSGRDCSVVRLEQGRTYCASVDPPAAERVCTRTLAAADCWEAGARPVGVAVGDTPAPTVAQARYRAARWPKTLTFE